MITLNQTEIAMAAYIGSLRRTESIRQKLTPAHGYSGEDIWGMDIEGAAAEIAYCKHEGIYWGGTVNTFKEADAGKCIQIRSTQLRNGCLIVRKGDNEDHFYVLVIGKIPHFEVVGYIQGRDAKKDEWKKSPLGREPAWFVPQSALTKKKIKEVLDK